MCMITCLWMCTCVYHSMSTEEEVRLPLYHVGPRD